MPGTQVPLIEPPEENGQSAEVIPHSSGYLPLGFYQDGAILIL